MSTISDPGFMPAVPPLSSERLLTAADLACLPAELPSGPALYELDNGRLIIMPPPGEVHGSIELRIASPLFTQGELCGHGKASAGEVGILLWRNPDRVVGADAVFIANKSFPIRHTPEGYLETIPDLVLEVMSKNDVWEAVKRKVEDYLKAGVRVIWVADLARRIVTEFRRGQETVYAESDFLVAEDIIPGFRCAVVDVFRGL
jgi:Uma2 family endonuclease